MPEAPDFVTRLWFAWVAFFRVLLDSSFAARAWAVRDAMPEPPKPTAKELPAKEKPAKEQPAPASEGPPPAAAVPAKDDVAATELVSDARREGREQGALLVLSLLQSDGRLIDFLQQDIADFPDADVGAAVRVVHEGCRKALKGRIGVEAVRSESEGARVTLAKGFDKQAIKLTGNVGKLDGAVSGVLRHKGWRAASVTLPEPTSQHAAAVLCPAEVEL